MLNLNQNFAQNSFAGASNGCRCNGTYGRMGSVGNFASMDQMLAMSPMMTMLTLKLMTLMTQLMQMLEGGVGMSGGPGAFGGTSAGSPLGSFLGGGGAASPSFGGRGGPSAGGGVPSGAAPSGGNVDPNTVRDKTGTSGLSSAAQAGLNEAHRYGLPLVSGKRSGSGTSDHDSGNAIDVGTLPIGAASSTGGTPDMKAYAEFMRQEGKAGRRNVKYVIADGRIASAQNNWEWRPYTYPGKSQAQLDQLKRTNPGEYNRLQHNDHVHVSFK